MEPSALQRNWYLLALLGVLLLGGGIRFYQLGTEALWTDEIVSWVHTQQEDFHSLVRSVEGIELLPVGYFVLLSQWVKMVGDSEFSLRFLSAAVDTGSILVMFLLGSLLFGRKVGLLSSLLLATTMLQVVYAQEARPYALFGFLALLATYLLFLYSQYHTKNKRKSSWFGLLYILTMGISLYVNYMAFFLFLIHALIIVFWIRNKSIIHDFLPAAAVSFLLFIPAVPTLYKQATLRQPILQEMFSAKGLPDFFAMLGIGVYILPLSLLLVLAGIVLWKRTVLLAPMQDLLAKRYVPLFFIMILIVGMALHIFFLEQTLRSFALIRHSFFGMLAIYLGLAKGIDFISKKRIQILALLLLLLFNAGTLYAYYHTTTKAPWPEVVSLIGHQSPEEGKGMILFDRTGANPVLYRYYGRYYGGRSLPTINLTTPEGYGVRYMNQDELYLQLDSLDYFWFISSRYPAIEEHYLRVFSRYEALNATFFPSLHVYLYQKD